MIDWITWFLVCFLGVLTAVLFVAACLNISELLQIRHMRGSWTERERMVFWTILCFVLPVATVVAGATGALLMLGG